MSVFRLLWGWDGTLFSSIVPCLFNRPPASAAPTLDVVCLGSLNAWSLIPQTSSRLPAKIQQSPLTNHISKYL